MGWGDYGSLALNTLPCSVRFQLKTISLLLISCRRATTFDELQIAFSPTPLSTVYFSPLYFFIFMDLTQSHCTLWTRCIGIASSPQNIVWRYIIMQLSCHFQNIVKISISHFFLSKVSQDINNEVCTVNCLQFASKIKITWLFAFVRTYL